MSCYPEPAEVILKYRYEVINSRYLEYILDQNKHFKKDISDLNLRIKNLNSELHKAQDSELNKVINLLIEDLGRANEVIKIKDEVISNKYIECKGYEERLSKYENIQAPEGESKLQKFASLIKGLTDSNIRLRKQAKELKEKNEDTIKHKYMTGEEYEKYHIELEKFKDILILPYDPKEFKLKTDTIPDIKTVLVDKKKK